MQVLLMRLMSKGEYLIVPEGTKFTGSGKLGLNAIVMHSNKAGNKSRTPILRYGQLNMA